MKPIDKPAAAALVVRAPDRLTYQDVLQIVELVRAALRFERVDVQLGELRISVERADVSPAAAVGAKAAASAQDTTTVLAPGLGYFRRAAAPEGPVLALVGRMLAPDDIIGAIEVMRQRTEVRAGVAGELVEVLAEEGALVEFDQPLVRIRHR